ncbi:aldolase [Microlunatus speluncae]|uniref:aldolase n=1 Tax=Microlunatus speluncae TaxID=2594267 RepID=UPI00137614C4|nr:aldolase [Microlunatus speluncae]
MTNGLGALANPGGRFGMVALDQRESLRGLLSRTDRPAGDDELRGFKAAAVRALSPLASAVLLDRPFGLSAAGTAVAPPAPYCGLILAVDDFDQPAGRPVRASRLDPLATPELIARAGAAALKLLIIWRDGEDPGPRQRTVRDFLQLCRETGLPSILEGVVRPPLGSAEWAGPDQRAAAIVAAAREFGRSGPTLYKTEVPGDGRDPELVQRCGREISAALDGPWVVLSTGVSPEDFPGAVEAACRGGASGFLAGRGIWSEAARSDDWAGALATTAVERLRRLLEVVA